jgi:predicted phosphodiesterase
MPDECLGVISDTHGLLRDEALAALQGSSMILHAGDVGASASFAPCVKSRRSTPSGATSTIPPIPVSWRG